MRTLIIGMADGALPDYGVVERVTSALAAELQLRDDVVIHGPHREVMDVMEAMAGFDRAFVIDSIAAGKNGCVVAVHAFRPDQSWPRQYSHSDEGGTLRVALELGRSAGLPLPDEIRIWAIEHGSAAQADASLGLELERAVQTVAEQIRRRLGAGGAVARARPK
jgi:hydrogenase maturation protease